MGESHNTAVDMVDRNVAQGRSGKVALIDPARRLTCGELAEQRARRADAGEALPAARRPRRDEGARHGRFPDAVPLNTRLTAEQYR